MSQPRLPARANSRPVDLIPPTLKTSTTEYSQYLAVYSTYLDALEASRHHVSAAEKQSRDPGLRRRAVFDHYVLYTWYDGNGKVLKVSKDIRKAPEGFARQKQTNMCGVSHKVETVALPQKAIAKPEKSAEALKQQVARHRAANRRQRARKVLRDKKAAIERTRVETQLAKAKASLAKVKSVRPLTYAQKVKATTGEPAKKQTPAVEPSRSEGSTTPKPKAPSPPPVAGPSSERTVPEQAQDSYARIPRPPRAPSPEDGSMPHRSLYDITHGPERRSAKRYGKVGGLGPRLGALGRDRHPERRRGEELAEAAAVAEAAGDPFGLI